MTNDGRCGTPSTRTWEASRQHWRSTHRTAKQINHLVRKRYIDIPKITTLEINDRSKSDSLAKFLAIMQVGWLAVHVVARTIQHLETTTLEVTTLSFVVCTLGSFIAWYRKPYDVQIFIILEIT